MNHNPLLSQGSQREHLLTFQALSLKNRFAPPPMCIHATLQPYICTTLHCSSPTIRRRSNPLCFHYSTLSHPFYTATLQFCILATPLWANVSLPYFNVMHADKESVYTQAPYRSVTSPTKYNLLNNNTQISYCNMMLFILRPESAHDQGARLELNHRTCIKSTEGFYCEPGQFQLP